jgi:hypothetical protein
MVGSKGDGHGYVYSGDQLPERPVMQSHGITLAFHREMADSSGELVGPDIIAAATLERYPGFTKGGFTC